MESINFRKLRTNFYNKNKIKKLQTKTKMKIIKLTSINCLYLFFSFIKKFRDEEIKNKKSIDEVGFKNTAIIYSLSNTSSAGGNIGWIKSTQLSKK